MAAMTTALTEFSDKENSRSYIIEAGHTVQKPQMVLQRRRVPSTNQITVEDVVTVLYGTEDSAGDYLDGRVKFTVTVTRPKTGIAADVTAALATFRDIIAGDEFTAVTTKSKYLT